MIDNPPQKQKSLAHRPPTEATVKQLYATAFLCGMDGCAEPLYRMNNDTGMFVLNSNIAHIRARSEGGPRWDPLMSEEDNRSLANLMPMCQPHAFQIDAEPEAYPVEMLHELKAAQIDDYLERDKGWNLNAKEVKDVSEASFTPQDYGLASTAAASMAAAAKAVGILCGTARHQRSLSSNAASAWQAMRLRFQQGFSGAWDADTGEQITVEPPRAESARYEQSMIGELNQAAEKLRPLVTALGGELHAVRSAAGHLAPWCEWIERAAENLLEASSRWPGTPPKEDDDVLSNALTELERSSSAMSAAWRKEPGDQPPVPPTPDPEPAETEDQRRFREHCELLEAARPWARVTKRAYDPELFGRLMAAAQYALGLPYVLKLIPYDLEATAGLVASVSRNASDSVFAGILRKATSQNPLAVSVISLRELLFVARATGRTSFEKEAGDEAARLLGEADWNSVEVWTDNRFYVRRLLGWTTSISSEAEVRARIAAALTASPELLRPILLGISTHHEQRDPQDHSQLLGFGIGISDLPTWFPTADVIAEVGRQYPDLRPTNSLEDSTAGDDFLRLAALLLSMGSSQRD